MRTQEDILVDHPSSNYSKPDMLNLKVLWRSASKKKLQLIGMSILLIVLSRGSGCHSWSIHGPLCPPVNYTNYQWALLNHLMPRSLEQYMNLSLNHHILL